MSNKKTSIVERVYLEEKNLDFKAIIKLIIDNKIEELVNNASKVNTATSQSKKKGNEIL